MENNENKINFSDITTMSEYREYIKQKYKNIKSYITTVPIVYLTYEYNSNVQKKEDKTKIELYSYYKNIDKQYYYIYNETNNDRTT